jgi:hypothetical protein
MTTDHWHFGRPELAQEYLAAFERGLTSARGLFARRRMGKTEFLKQDLIPAAKAAGYLTAYVNLWDNRDDPGEALVAALYEAMQARGVGKVIERLRTPVKKIKASGKVPGVGEGSFETELGDHKPRSASLLTEAMQKLDSKKKKLLLVIDEAQMLASVPNSNFAHALRASLDIRKRTIKVIFAGSSETTLRSMFARPSEPFYNWAGLEPFQLLGNEFVEAMVGKVADISRHPLQLADALSAFKELRNTPESTQSKDQTLHLPMRSSTSLTARTLSGSGRKCCQRIRPSSTWSPTAPQTCIQKNPARHWPKRLDWKNPSTRARHRTR